MNHNKKTKIVATLGPSGMDGMLLKPLQQLHYKIILGCIKNFLE
jgi:pyruvate kinase